MRQQFGLKMLDLLADGKRVLNIDETWLGQTNYQRQVWQTKRHTQSLSLAVVNPRISMIVALDTFGDLYLELHQSNTNADSFCQFISGLVEKLDRDRPGWRDDTIWQIDGAKYHLTDQVKDVLR